MVSIYVYLSSKISNAEVLMNYLRSAVLGVTSESVLAWHWHISRPMAGSSLEIFVSQSYSR